MIMHQLNSPDIQQGEGNKIYPTFDYKGIGIDDIKGDAEKHLKAFEPIEHKAILTQLLEQVQPIDFDALAFPQKEKMINEVKQLRDSITIIDPLTGTVGTTTDKTTAEVTAIRDKANDIEKKINKLNAKEKHFIIISIEQIIELAQKNDWGICKSESFVYLYNGNYWYLCNKGELQSFFGKASQKMGVSQWDAKFYDFREKLFKQFLAVANLPKPDQPNDTVFINLKNGTFEISPKCQFLRPPNRNDFITYQLPFEYNPKAKAPLFQHYLNTVQPDTAIQQILAEYLGYVFIKNGTLKLEKTLLLYGTGANGKSVFSEIVYALLGKNNVCTFSLQNLTNENGYYRAMIANKLVNYATEINGKLEASTFKQLVSGEPIEARLPYGEPMVIYNYAKMIFNCNELPKDVEQTNAYFRRFLIVPFDVTIPEHQQDKELSNKIIASELSGIFNWVLEGLNRLLIQKRFTNSEAVNKQLEMYRLQSDSVQLFLQEDGYEQCTTQSKQVKELFAFYTTYCSENGYHRVSTKNFTERLRKTGYLIERKNYGMIVYIKKISCF